MNRLENLDKKLSEYKKKYLPPKKVDNKSSGAAGFVITELIGAIVVASFLGYYLDKYFGTKILFLLLFIILGLVSAFYNIYNKYK